MLDREAGGSVPSTSLCTHHPNAVASLPGTIPPGRNRQGTNRGGRGLWGMRGESVNWRGGVSMLLKENEDDEDEGTDEER
jgi:hypothetical protein